MKKVVVKSDTKKIESEDGFSLSALIIVIIIMGIFGAILISVIDPVEKIKRDQDDRLIDSASQFINADISYYSKNAGLPWFGFLDKGANCYPPANTLSSVPMTDLTNCILTMIDDGDLQNDYLTATNNLNTLVVTNPNPQTGKSLDSAVCFLPQSKSLQKDPETHFNRDASSANGCKSNGGTKACYWCAQ